MKLHFVIVLTLVTTLMSQKAFGQIYSAKSGSDNPFNGIDLGDLAAPTFADLDNNGVYDAFIGTIDGNIYYLKNTGSKTQPQFALSPTLNPLAAINVGGFSFPTFVDIDADLDKDLFVGSAENGITFFENVGTPALPIFQSAAGPLASIMFDFFARPVFVDIDNDGDVDLFVGDFSGTTHFYENTGSFSVAQFGNFPTMPSPLEDALSVQTAAPAFEDLDRDGDFDFILGGSGNALKYFQNIGSAAIPEFALRTGNLSPLNSIAAVSVPIAGFVDIDSDGDLEVFVGGAEGLVQTYQNNTINLPLKLIAFTATPSSSYSTISWKTADEKNTAYFHLEASANGINFFLLKSLPAFGKGNNNYATRDSSFSSTRYYRLKMLDNDATYSFSPIVKAAYQEPDKFLKVFPNPASSILHIQRLTSSPKKLRGEITDLTGKHHLNFALTTEITEVSVRHLRAGQYLLKISDGSTHLFLKK